jgi:hypothetical protein
MKKIKYYRDETIGNEKRIIRISLQFTYIENRIQTFFFFEIE